MIDNLARQGIAYVPFFPLGGFTPLQSSTLSKVANKLGAKPMQVALAWLLHRSPNILLIPGTSSVAHLRENLDAGSLTLSRENAGGFGSNCGRGRACQTLSRYSRASRGIVSIRQPDASAETASKRFFLRSGFQTASAKASLANKKPYFVIAGRGRGLYRAKMSV